ncbi:hypothetical protein DFI02_101335 [Rhizobium sp. PP-F2F-G20b]|nr:hypothetical protein C8J32_101595 [Rhizobium sp. PP-CC-3A-592]PYE46196.1 hypothetical protein DFI02_101335 [Rhizobium sp. PP-F2F-G20b]
MRLIRILFAFGLLRTARIMFGWAEGILDDIEKNE